MDSSHDLNVSMGENETAQIPSRNSGDDGLDHSLDRQSRQSSPERDIQSQISSLATDVKNTVMSLSDTMQIRFERFNEKLSDMQSQISNLENRNTNNETGGTSIFSFPPSNTFRGQGESAILSTGSRENSNIKVRPQLYDGLSDIDEYLTQFNIVAQINQWGSNIKALHLASCLTGNARSLLSELDQEHQQNFSCLVSPKRYSMVIRDYFTKWTEAIPLENLEAKTVARALIDNFISRFGVPLFIHTDQGTSFESKLFQETCQILGIKKTRTTKARPQSDGMIERANRTIINMLSAFVSDHQRDWDQYVPLVMMAYRSSVHDSIDTSASMMMLGREIPLPIDLIFGSPDSERNEYVYGSLYAKELQDRLIEVHEFARKRMKIASDAMKRKYDLKSNLREFNIDDSVWVYDPIQSRCES